MEELRAKGNVFIWDDGGWIEAVYDSYESAEKAIRECYHHISDEQVKELIEIRTLWGI